MKEIEKAFATTAKILFGRELHNIDEYGPWLEEHVRGRVKRMKSKVSGAVVHCPSMGYYEGLGGNIVTAQEALEMGKKHLTEEEAAKLSLENAGTALEEIKTTTPEIVWGTNVGTEECSNYGPTQYCYRSTFTWFSKYIAYSFCPRDGEYLFGCAQVIEYSNFCMRCYSSTKLSRCFEMSDSTNCADSYFCHNGENLQDCMFCFNAKNLKYAIGNREIGREAYMKVKAMVLAQVADELEKEKRCEYDVYKLGVKNKIN